MEEMMEGMMEGMMNGMMNGIMNGNFTEWISIGIGFWWKGTQISSHSAPRQVTRILRMVADWNIYIFKPIYLNRDSSNRGFESKFSNQPIFKSSNYGIFEVI